MAQNTVLAIELFLGLTSCITGATLNWEPYTTLKQCGSWTQAAATACNVQGFVVAVLLQGEGNWSKIGGATGEEGWRVPCAANHHQPKLELLREEWIQEAGIQRDAQVREKGGLLKEPV